MGSLARLRPILQPGAGLAVVAQQISLQSQMSSLISAFWLITASYVVIVPLLMLLKPGKKAAGDAPGAIAD